MNNYDAQEQQLQAQRQRYAQQLQGAQQAPQGRMVGRTYVAANPLEYLAQGLRGMGAIRGEEMAGQQIKDLQTERTGANQSAMANALRMMGGAPADVLPEDQAGPVRGAQAPDMRGAYGELMKSPDYAQMGQQGMMQIPAMEAQAQARMDDRAFRAQESEMNRSARAAELQTKLEEGRASQAEKIAAQKELRQMQIDARKDMARLAASMRPAPQPQQAQTLQTENGMLERVNGKWQPITIEGKAVMPKGLGSNAPTPEVAKVKDANDAISLLQQAAPLVRGATGSGIGAGADWLAGQVGVATKGAENIAQLKTIAGMLVSKMPKMTGPQSDKDVMLYKEMAGNIGDPNVPTALKEKAMQTIMEIQARYAGVQPPALEFGAAAKQMNPQDAQAMEWARANPNDPRSKAILQRLGGQ